MIRGLYTAAKAMYTESKRVDVLANNIANVDTSGYKKDEVVTGAFLERLISRLNDNGIGQKVQSFKGVTIERTGDRVEIHSRGAYLVVDTPRGKSFGTSALLEVNPEGYLVTTSGNFILGEKGRIRVESADDLYIDDKGKVYSGGQVVDKLKLLTGPNVIGTLNAGSRVENKVVSFIQGNLKETGKATDLAVRGEGFFTVLVDGEERYTRDGSFIVDAQGFLATKEGYRVLGERGEIPLGHDKFDVKPNGEIYKEGELIDRLKLVSFQHPEYLAKTGDNLYRARGEAGPRAGIEGKVLQGFLEGSNVNAIKEMVNMIAAFRSYEANQRLVTAYDRMLEKAVNEIGRT